MGGGERKEERERKGRRRRREKSLCPTWPRRGRRKKKPTLKRRGKTKKRNAPSRRGFSGLYAYSFSALARRNGCICPAERRDAVERAKEREQGGRGGVAILKFLSVRRGLNSIQGLEANSREKKAAPIDPLSRPLRARSPPNSTRFPRLCLEPFILHPSGKRRRGIRAQGRSAREGERQKKKRTMLSRGKKKAKKRRMPISNALLSRFPLPRRRL